MTTADDPVTEAAPAPALSWSPFRLYFMLVVSLAVLEGALAGGLQGGIEGAVNGGIFGVLIGPGFAYEAWKLRKDRRRFWSRFLLGVAVEAVGGLLIGLAARFLAGFPVWLFAAAMALAVVMIFTYLGAVRRETRWAVRGAVAGAAAGVVVGIVGGIIVSAVALGQGAGREAPIALAIVGLCLPIDGAFAGAFWGAALRHLVRQVRSAWIRARCRRRRRVSRSEAFDLADLDLAFAGGPARAGLTALLLRALADRARAVHFEALGAVCRVRQEHDGAVRELVPLRVPAVDLVQEVFALGRLTQAAGDGGWRGNLDVRLGDHAATVTAVLRPEAARLGGCLRLGPGVPPAEEARRALRDYEELLGESWEQRLVPITVGEGPGQAAAPPRRGVPGEAEQQPAAELRGSRLRLAFVPDAPYAGVQHALRVEFDGELLGVSPLSKGFSYWVEAAPGNHLLQLDANHRWTWMGKAYLLRVPEEGDYEVRLRWHRWWNNFHSRVDVAPATD
jgi:hypothetical protein